MKNSSITGRILAIFVLGLWTVLCLTATGNAAAEPKKNVPQPQPYQVELEKAMEIYFTFLQSLALEKGLTKAEKEKKAIAYAKKFRFGPKNEDYLMLMDLKGTLVMDPYQPHLDGQSLLAWKDPNGQQPFKIMREMIILNPEGYISYLWPKYGGEKPVPTVAYIKTMPDFKMFAAAVTPINTIEGYIPPAFGAFVSLLTVDIDNTGVTSTGTNQ